MMLGPQQGQFLYNRSGGPDCQFSDKVMDSVPNDWEATSLARYPNQCQEILDFLHLAESSAMSSGKARQSLKLAMGQTPTYSGAPAADVEKRFSAPAA